MQGGEVKTTVIHVRDMKPGDVYIGRDPRYGATTLWNMFRMGRNGTREHVVERYRDYFMERIITDQNFRANVLLMAGKRLACHCVPLPCHGDVVAAWLNEQENPDAQ